MCDFARHFDHVQRSLLKNNTCTGRKIAYYSGPRAKLKSRIITMEHIAKMLKKSTDAVVENLVDAYEVRPADLGEEGERELFEVIERDEVQEESAIVIVQA